ncbi:MAG: hypothetical protein GC189_08395 [Alphaproteobacteria bacterium]|nr:hypothetical protein [Alphaproteobacteria bacterium]
MKTVKELREKEAATSREGQLVYSTSEGRAKFPDLLQSSFGDKKIIGFDRYGRIMGAVVPIEAVRMLAGLSDHVEEDTRSRIQKTARHLLAQLPNEAVLLEPVPEPRASRLVEGGARAKRPAPQKGRGAPVRAKRDKKH